MKALNNLVTGEWVNLGRNVSRDKRALSSMLGEVSESVFRYVEIGGVTYYVKFDLWR